MPNRVALRYFLTGLAMLCFGVVLMPSYFSFERPNERHSIFRLGLPFSPWLQIEKIHARELVPGQNESWTNTDQTNAQVEVLSWSAAIAVVMVAALVLSRRLAPRASTVHKPVSVEIIGHPRGVRSGEIVR